MPSKYEIPGEMAQPDNCPYRSPMEEFIQSPDAPSYRDLFEKWGGSLKNLKVVAADGKWRDKRKEYWSLKEVSDIPDGVARIRSEDREALDALTYDLDNGTITLDQFRSQALPAILRGLISLTGSGATETAHKALWNIAQLITARPSEDVDQPSRYERRTPEEIIDALAAIQAGQEPEI